MFKMIENTNELMLVQLQAMTKYPEYREDIVRCKSVEQIMTLCNTVQMVRDYAKLSLFGSVAH